ncbi:MAG: antibiotic biosynthesis monooxygenase [Candidatus Dormibacteraeota bacterium]|uniref:Antibiotic biosynthesis monooxygenase n=1 Tax=Candidatus Aeolococcus gillhamiae TaxID=3127015 RepID=A0A934K260_9BACT|nr:antibiotic biosynthesis monooxygenase [Candidatus Dormibacteraeota bacterium]MBJ7605197.1 antibiotic biosynthesis monooxygenase [Candidatus Dormibacteraeota bacterium]
MTSVSAGALGTVRVTATNWRRPLTQHHDLLRERGCSVYEVGIHADAPDIMFVVEVWDSQEAHRRSLEHPEVQTSIAVARPILSGEFGGFRFDVIGSPLREA